MTDTQRSILITGTSTGIGRDAARSLHRRGWNVIATARNDRDIAGLRADGLNAVLLDYARQETIKPALDAMLDQAGGRIDALFNNGAYGQTGALEDVATEHLRAQFEANLFGWHELTRHVIPIMRAQGAGRIVQCSSVLGFVAAPYRGPYTASKFALEGYTDTLRIEVARFGIKVISIQPGPITSRFRANGLAVFQRTIDTETSAYADDYQHQLKRLTSSEKAAFELGPQAVTRALIHALEKPNPRPVYRITTPTKLMAFARRVLPIRALHAVLAKGTRR